MGAEESCACASAARAPPGGKRAAAPPRKFRVFRAVLCGGGGEGEKGDRGHLGSPSSQKGLGEERWFMEAALTAAAAATAATFAAAATAWRSPIHPPAAGETQSLGGAWGRGRPPPSCSRLPELPLAPPTLCPPLRLRPPPWPPAASQPRGRLLSPGSTVSMTPGKHSGASAVAANARGWGAGTPGAAGERGGRSLPSQSPPCPPPRETPSGSPADRKFRR